MTADEFHAKMAELRERAKRSADEWAAESRTLPTLSEAQRAFLGREDDPVVHWCNWSQQPDIHFACGINTTPAWGQPGENARPRQSLAWLADNGSAYVFDADDRVTCAACAAALASEAEQ